MALGFGPSVPERQVADAARFLLELIVTHGHEAIRLSRSRGLASLLLFRDEVHRRRDHLSDLAERTREGRLRNAALAFVRAHRAWEDLVRDGVGSREADQRAGFSRAARALQQELGNWA